MKTNKNNATEKEKNIAITLHEALCCSNHTDQCGWFYEDWDGWTHQKYLKIARKILKDTDFNTAKKNQDHRSNMNKLEQIGKDFDKISEHLRDLLKSIISSKI